MELRCLEYLFFSVFDLMALNAKQRKFERRAAEQSEESEMRGIENNEIKRTV